MMFYNNVCLFTLDIILRQSDYFAADTFKYKRYEKEKYRVHWHGIGFMLHEGTKERNMTKRPRKPTLRAATRYFLLQLPGILFLILLLGVFQQLVTIPTYLVWILLGFWIAKDILLFPFLWRYYDTNQLPDTFEMVGRKGFALTRLNPDGHVQVHGERWKAISADENIPIEPGETVYVDEVKGLRLTVTKQARTKTS